MINLFNMNIQKSTLHTFLKEIITAEESLEVLRQLLNEQISFTPEATFRHISSNCRPLDVFMLKQFLSGGKQEDGFSCDDASIESLIKFYSKGNLHLGMYEWKALFLSREDHLLAKLTQEREEVGKEIPQYILNYCRKILIKECCLHAFLVDMYNQKNWKIIEKISENKQVNEAKLQQLCQDLLPELESPYVELIFRYLKQGETGKSIYLEDIKPLLIHTNTAVITKFINKKQAQFIEKENKITISNNPYVHRQFKKLARNVDLNKTTNLRHVKSIETHLHRNKMPSSSKIIKNIQKFTIFLEKQLRIFCRSFDKIMKLNAHIVQAKRQLLAVNQVNFSLLFSQISKNKEIIPSQLQHYLHNLQLNLPLTSLFLLFKRYSDPVSGKMNKSQFTRIFKLLNPPKTVKSTCIDKKFRHNVALCILHEIQYEFKIEEEKKLLMERADLRQIFQVIDSNHDKYISITDLKVIYKKITNSNCKEDHLQEFWWRMGASQPQMVDYDRFMYELIPRIKDKAGKR